MPVAAQMCIVVHRMVALWSLVRERIFLIDWEVASSYGLAGGDGLSCPCIHRCVSCYRQTPAMAEGERLYG